MFIQFSKNNAIKKLLRRISRSFPKAEEKKGNDKINLPHAPLLRLNKLRGSPCTAFLQAGLPKGQGISLETEGGYGKYHSIRLQEKRGPHTNTAFHRYVHTHTQTHQLPTRYPAEVHTLVYTQKLTAVRKPQRRHRRLFLCAWTDA